MSYYVDFTVSDAFIQGKVDGTLNRVNLIIATPGDRGISLKPEIGAAIAAVIAVELQDERTRRRRRSWARTGL